MLALGEEGGSAELDIMKEVCVRSISSMNAGTMMGRTINVSSSIPNPRANPSWSIAVRDPLMSARKVPAIITPQLEIIPPV